MSTLRAPDVLAGGRWRSGGELDALARGWRAAVLDRCGDAEPAIAVALPPSPEAVALFVALTSLPSPVILLSADVRAWRTEPAIPKATPVVLLPALARLASAAEEFGLVPIVLPDEPAPRGAPITPLQGPGVVVFTSGSTGAPKPVFHTPSTLTHWVSARNRALGLGAGDGTIMEASPAHAQGLGNLVGAILLGGPLGFLDPRDHRQALVDLAHPEFRYWRASPHFADVLSRCALTGPAIVPPLCMVGTPIPEPVREAFRERFGVPLRQVYSSTETGNVAADAGPPASVQPETVGHPLPGVEVSIGERPGEARSPGEIGRIWVRHSWHMAGYGFPPSVERPGMVGGWWPTSDLGTPRADGRLVLAGRVDDAIRTRDNRVVSLAQVTEHLRGVPGVTDALVIPIESRTGRSFGAVVECDPAVSAAALRAKLAETLPPWSWPRAVETVPVLPRLPNGKPDRRACAVLLGQGPLA